MIEHHFMSTWILQPKGGQSVCAAGDCRIDIKRRNDTCTAPASAFPCRHPKRREIRSLHQPLRRPADHIRHRQYRRQPATGKRLRQSTLVRLPLFWLLNQLHNIIGNWGWAIIVLTIIVKAVLYPLTNASTARWQNARRRAPKLQAIKEKYGDDRMAQQQAMMQLFTKTKNQPAGRLPAHAVANPVFIGLYWALFASVELRQAPWLGWITDLSRSDPYYILPVIMAVTMFAQTFLNPPPTDPMQAK